MKPQRIAIAVAVTALLAAGPAQAQVAAGAFGGAGEALQDIGRDLMQYGNERELMERHHALQMQRIEREHELRRRALREERARAAPAAPDRYVVIPWQQERDERRKAGVRKVEAAHPGWVRIVQSDAFGIWIAGQPPSVERLRTSPRAEDAILLLDLFKRDHPSTRIPLNLD